MGLKNIPTIIPQRKDDLLLLLPKILIVPVVVGTPVLLHNVAGELFASEMGVSGGKDSSQDEIILRRSRPWCSLSLSLSPALRATKKQSLDISVNVDSRRLTTTNRPARQTPNDNALFPSPENCDHEKLPTRYHRSPAGTRTD